MDTVALNYFHIPNFLIWSNLSSTELIWLLLALVHLETLRRCMTFFWVSEERTPVTTVLAFFTFFCLWKVSKLSLMTNLSEERTFHGLFLIQLKHQASQLLFSQKGMLLLDGVSMNFWRSSNASTSMDRLWFQFSIKLIHHMWDRKARILLLGSILVSLKNIIQRRCKDGRRLWPKQPISLALILMSLGMIIFYLILSINLVQVIIYNINYDNVFKYLSVIY